jgi:hypothetical protein
MNWTSGSMVSGYWTRCGIGMVNSPGAVAPVSPRGDGR